MIFRNSLAWIGLAALLVPLAIHLLVRAPARPIVLASLRFVPTSPMRALRRRVLNDAGLLAVRLGTLTLAVAALADPLVSQACRRDAWNARVARAVVVETHDAATADAPARDLAAVFASHEISTPDLRAGLSAAVRWLDAAPPARREIALIGEFRLGSLDGADVHDVPADVGLRFVRHETSDTPRPVAGAPITRAVDGSFVASRSLVTVNGERTVTATNPASGEGAISIDETPASLAVPALSFQAFAPAPSRPALRAALTAALAVGVPVPPTPDDRPVVLMLDDEGRAIEHTGNSTAKQLWIGDAIARIAVDPDVVSEARTARGSRQSALDSRWIPVARDDERRIVAAAASGTAAAATANGPRPALLLLVHGDVRSSIVPALVRAALHARMPETSAPGRTFAAAEALTISDAQLERWSRPSRDVDIQSPRTVTISDRRWLWTMVLALLGLETWMRRRRRHSEDSEERSRVRAA